ncbi:hypothetical protein D3C74_281720 [compost metagenome]
MAYMKQSKRFMRQLTSDIHLYTAQMERTPVVVFVAGELVGSGKISEITENSVRVVDERYLRAVCEFKRGEAF